ADGLREHLDRWRVAGVVATPLLQELRPVVELVEEVSELVRDLGEHAIVSGRVTILEPRTVCWRVGGGDARFGFRRLVGRHRRSDWAANAQEPAGYRLVRALGPKSRKPRATRIQLTRDADHLSRAARRESSNHTRGPLNLASRHTAFARDRFRVPAPRVALCAHPGPPEPGCLASKASFRLFTRRS